MPVQEKGFSLHDIEAFGAGLGVTIVSALLLGPTLAPALSAVLSFGLGGATMYGVRKVLDPRTQADVIHEQAQRDFRSTLAEIDELRRRVAASSERPCVGAESAARLSSIARKVELVLERHRERERDLAAASRTLLLLRKFDAVLDHYVKVKCGELFVSRQEAAQLIARTERRTLPRFDEALEKLLTQMDRIPTGGAEVQEGTLEDMLRSLDLIESLSDEQEALQSEGGLDDKQN